LSYYDGFQWRPGPEPKCSRCHTTMYLSQTSGMYGCRNFDCPPGREARHQTSWKLKELLLPLFMNIKSGEFTVEELHLIQHPDSGEYYGYELLKLAKKFKIAPANAIALAKQVPQKRH